MGDGSGGYLFGETPGANGTEKSFITTGDVKVKFEAYCLAGVTAQAFGLCLPAIRADIQSASCRSETTFPPK